MKTNIDNQRIRFIKEVLKSRGVKFEQAEIVKNFNISKGTVSKMFNGGGVSDSFFESFCKHYEAKFIPENFIETKNKQNQDITTKNGLVFTELEDGSYMVMVDLIPFEAHAKYVFQDLEEFRDWEKISFNVDKIGRGNYKAFRVKGDSMYNYKNPSFFDTPDRALLFCRELGKHHWQDGFNHGKAPLGWILVTTDNIMLKDIINFNKETGDIVCHSRNPSPEYADFTYNLNSVKQIFKVIKRTL